MSARLPKGYRAELERINGAVKRNRDALADQKRLGREMAKDVERELAARIAGNQKLSDMDRAAMAAQAQRARRRDAEMAKIRRANPVDTVAVGQVHAGTSARTLAEQAAAINKALALNKALVAQYDKVILAEQALGKQTGAMEAVRAREAAALAKNIKKQDELTAALKRQTAAEVEADKKAKKVTEFKQQRVSGQDTRDRRYRYEKAAADARLDDRRRGIGPNLKGTAAELRQQNMELEKAAKWHDKMAQALAQEELRAKSLGISYSHISRDLSDQVFRLTRVRNEQQQVNKALRERERLERQSIKNQTDLAAKVRANIAANQAGHKIVSQRGGYANFNASGLNLKEAKLASEALNQMAAAMRNAFQKQTALGTATEKMRQNLDRVSTSARNAKEAVATMQREAASAHGMKKFNQELLSTIKNFAKFAVVYQGLYAVLGYVKSLAGAVFDLNAQLANMQAITAESSKSMQTISTAILQTAANSRFSVGEMTEAAKVIAQAGKSAEELPKILKAVSDFSAGTDTSLATAADIITSIGEVYKDLSEADIANQLTKAVNISKLNGEDLKTILSLGAQVGEGYNVTSEQMLSAASVLRNAGIKASTIATGMRQAMLEVFNLQDNSAEALQKAYQNIGEDLSISDIKAKFYNFKNEADPLLAVLRELKKLGFGAGGDFTLGRAFDVRALNVLKALTNNTQDYLKLQKEVNFGQPAADAAATSMQSLSAQMTRFNNILAELMAQDVDGFFGKLAKGLKSLNDYLAKKKELGEEELSKRGESTRPELSTTDKILGYGKQAFYEASKYGVFGWEAALRAYADPSLTAGSTVSDERAQAASQSTIAKANQALDELQARLEAYDPNNDSEKGLGKFIKDYFMILDTVKEKTDTIFGAQTAESQKKIDELLAQYGNEADHEKRMQILEELKKSAANSEQVNDKNIAQISGELASLQASSAAAVDNAKALYSSLEEKVRQGDELAKAQMQTLNSGPNAELMRQMLRGGFGTEDPTKNVETFKTLAESISAGASEELKKALEVKSNAMATAFKNDLALAAKTPNGGAEAAVEAIINQYINSLSGLGAEAAAPLFARLQQIAAEALSKGGFVEKLLGKSGGSAENIATTVGIPGVVGEGGGVFPLKNGKDVFADTQKKIAEDKVKAEEEARQRYKQEHMMAVPEEVVKPFVPDLTANARANQLDFEITKLQKFGDAAGKAGDLINEKNAILAKEKQREIDYAREAAGKLNKTSDEYYKAEADIADKQLALQKMELQSKEEYLDNMQKSATKEVGMYDQQKASILAAGGSFEGLSEINEKFLATQKGLISEMEDYMRNTLHMTEEEIQKYIESNPALQRGLLTDKDINAVTKQHSAQEKAAAAAVPTAVTTGNDFLDAKARAGLGFTNQEQSAFAFSKVAGIQKQIDVANQLNASEAILAASSDRAAAEAWQASIDQRTASIKDMNLEIQDLAAEIETFSSTAASELASVFNADGIQFFTTALESSGNALKDWGDNIRDSLLTAWDSVGDAIAGAVLEGEDFVESMKKITRDLAKEVFTMTTKNMMNNLLLGAMTGSYGGATQPGQAAPGAAGGAAPAAAGGGGFLSTVASILGLTPAAAAGGAASAVGTMTVNAGVVNVNGAGGGGASTASQFPGLQGNEEDGFTLAPGEVAGPPAPEKSLFKTVEDKISSGMDSVMSSLEGAFKGLDKGLGGLLSGIGNVASDMFKGVADFDWGGMATKALSFFGLATGGIIPMKFAGGYVSKSGMIKGPGSGTSDSIRGSMYTKSGRAPIAVSSGESILTAKATSMLGEKTIKSLNAGTARKFSTGGMVARDRTNANSANLKTPSPSVIVNPAAPQSIQMINAIDSDSVVQAGLSSPGSVKTLVNIVKANKTAFKQVLT
jgi:TP901 family phage tail tape measure protein